MALLLEFGSHVGGEMLFDRKDFDVVKLLEM